MPGTAAQKNGSPLPTLAQRQLPRRVREILQGVLDYSADEIGRGLSAALDEYEQSLFGQSQQARSGDVRNVYTAALREVRRGRAELLQRFGAELEASLATLRDPPVTAGDAQAARPAPASTPSLSLSLVDDLDMEETIVINEIANRTEARSSLPLFLLGQRFGVLAAKPGFDPESLPLGPRRLCTQLQSACEVLELGAEHRQLLYKQFDRVCLQQIGRFYEALNSLLVSQRVLPNLTFVPIRPRPAVQNAPAQPARTSAGPTPAELGLETVAHEPRRSATDDVRKKSLAELAAQLAADPPEPQPATRWPGQIDPAGEAAAERQDTEMFSLLSELMSGRRSLVGKLGGRSTGNASSQRTAGDDELQHALARLQTQRPRHSTGPEQTGALKHELLAQLRQIAGGEASSLAEPDVDAIELVGLLLDHVMRELRPDSPAKPLLGHLQLPLLRVALADKGFFTRRQHPARQMLNAVAEATEFLNPGDSADQPLLERMRSLTARASQEYDGNPALFASLLADLNQHLQAQSRKAEVAERRHVEAARGKEKLETARMRAAETLDQLLQGKRVPRFLRTLLAQAWSDVLSLTLLRSGEQSEAYQQNLRIAERLIEIAVERRTSGTSPLGAEEAQQLGEAIESALTQVGYHQADAEAIAVRLAALSDEEEDDSASSTELAMRLKQRVRFGQEVEETAASLRKPSLNEAEQAELARIEKLPLGTWFEFTINQQGMVERRRLSWFSTVTGHCLFLNHRGQRVAECSLPWLAAEVVRGNVRILMEPPGTLVDRAWAGIVRALRSFAGSEEASS